MAEKSTILIIGGAFQTTEFYEPLQRALAQHELSSIVPTLPTCSRVSRIQLGQSSPADDVKVIQREVVGLVEQSKNVAILVHSYGGMVGASLNLHDLSVSARSARGLSGGVTEIIWFASVAVPEGMSFRQVNGGVIPDFDECMDDGTYNFLIADQTLLGELGEDDRGRWAAKVIPHTQKVFDYTYSDGAYKYVPNIAIVTEKDKAIPASYQEQFASSIGAKVVCLDAGHGVHLSNAGLLAAKIAEVIA